MALINNEIWVANGSRISVLNLLENQSSAIDAGAGRILTMISAHGSVWTGSFDKALLRWDVEAHAPMLNLTGIHGEAVNCLFALNDQMISGSDDGTCAVWSMEL
jgi:hypothetical protein